MHFNAWSSFCMFLLLLIVIGTPERADAYLDPGSGSFILQAAIAVLLAGAVTFRQSWHRLRNLFKSPNRDQSDLDLDD